MGLLQKFFPKKDGNLSEKNLHKWPALPVPVAVESTGNRAVLGKYSLEKQLGELQQARPPKKAQIILGKDQKNQPVYIGLIPPGEENQQWLEQRLGSIQNARWTTVKAHGYFRKLGDQLSLLTFDTVLADRYLIKKCLCSDPLQETYEAFDTKEQKAIYCTVSIPNSSNALPEKFLKRKYIPEKDKYNLSESRILRVLDEGICKPFGLFSAYRFKHPALYYVVTQYIPAVNFTHFLKQERQKLSPELAASLACQMVGILYQMKKEELQHGNFRPHTLWIGSEGEHKGILYLNGYSLMHSTEDYNSTPWQILRNCSRHGYPLYMAPEQMISKNVDLRADIFTMGLVLYEILTGRNPFRSSEKEEEKKKLANWDISKLTALPSSFKWLNPFLKNFLQTKPENREIPWDSFSLDLENAYMEWASEGAEEILATPKKESLPKKPLEKREQKPVQEKQKITKEAPLVEEEMEFEEIPMISSVEEKKVEEKKEPVEEKKEPKIYLFERFLSSFNRGIKKQKSKEKTEEKTEEKQTSIEQKEIKKQKTVEVKKQEAEKKEEVELKKQPTVKLQKEIKEKEIEKTEEKQEFEELSKEEILLLATEEDSNKEIPHPQEEIEELSEEELQHLAVSENSKKKQKKSEKLPKTIQKEQQEEWEDLEEEKQVVQDKAKESAPVQDEELEGKGISSLKEKTIPAEPTPSKDSENLEEKEDFFFKDLEKIKKQIAKKEEKAPAPEKEVEKTEVIMEIAEDNSTPLGFKEDEDFEWEKEFQVVTNSFVEWEEESDEEEIFTSDIESKKDTIEESQSKKKK